MINVKKFIYLFLLTVAKRGPEKIEYCKLQLISTPTLVIPPQLYHFPVNQKNTAGYKAGPHPPDISSPVACTEMNSIFLQCFKA